MKLAEKWLEQTHLTNSARSPARLAYQDAAREAVEQVWTSALGYEDAMKIDDRLAERIRSLPPPAEEADLSSSFSRDAALQRLCGAGDILGGLTSAAGLDEEQRVNCLQHHTRAIHQETRPAAFRQDRAQIRAVQNVDGDGRRKAGALGALQIHAKYQRDQYLSEPALQTRRLCAPTHICLDRMRQAGMGAIRGPHDARRGDFRAPGGTPRPVLRKSWRAA